MGGEEWRRDDLQAKAWPLQKLGERGYVPVIRYGKHALSEFVLCWSRSKSFEWILDHQWR